MDQETRLTKVEMEVEYLKKSHTNFEAYLEKIANAISSIDKKLTSYDLAMAKNKGALDASKTIVGAAWIVLISIVAAITWLINHLKPIGAVIRVFWEALIK